MTAFSLVADTNIDALTGKAGGDTYATNGYTLTIDQDSRNGLNQSTSASLGAITVSAVVKGGVRIDGRDIWMIPYTGGSGNVPAWNTVISNGTGSGKLIGVHTSLTAASTATGAAMPATGFIRVKQKTGTYSAAALTGITATASDAGRIGWIEIVGDEAATINANRPGFVDILGAWYEIGTTNGTSNQTMQIPNNGLLRYAAGVFIEKTVGGGDYEFYPNAGTATGVGTEATRGKVVWIADNGLVRIGNNGAGTAGYTPVTGLKVVIGNVFLENCTTAARTANVIPNATIATRYDFTCTGGGVVMMDKVNCAWYGSFSQAYNVALSNSGFVDGILLSEVASAITITKVGVGNKPTTALLMSPLIMSLCFAGGTFTDCVWARVSQAASSAHTNTLSDIYGFTFVRDTIRANTIRGNSTTYALNATRVNNCTWTDPTVIQGAMAFTTCNGITVTGTIYCEAVSGTTVTTYSGSVWMVASSTLNATFSGLTMPVTNTHPYTALLQINAAGCNNIKLRSIASRASPLTMGSANACGLIYALAAGAAASNVKVQRVYVSNTRTGIMTGDNSSNGIVEEHVFGDYADSGTVSAALNMTRKGLGTTLALTAQTAVYGTHWADYFISATVGSVAIMMNEATAQSAAQVTLSSANSFYGSAGRLHLGTDLGGSIYVIFETPHFIRGHTAFANSALVMAGGTAANHSYQYQIDLNDGAGWSAWSAEKTSTSLGTALAAHTLNAQLGFKLRLKIIGNIAGGGSFDSVYLTTVTSTTAQDYTYPLDTYTITFTGLPTGCDAIVLTAGTNTVLTQSDSISGTSYTYTYSSAQTVDVGFIKPGYIPYYIRNLSLGTTDSSVPVSLTQDRNYI